MCFPSEPSRTDTVQSQGGRGTDLSSCAVLAQLDLVPRIHAPHDSTSLAHSSEGGPAFSETGHSMAPASRPVETPCLVPGWDAEVLGDLPQAVVNTITSARAPSRRRLYALMWNLFVEWCSSLQEDPQTCLIRVVLFFLLDGLEQRLSPSTLKVYVAPIANKLLTVSFTVIFTKVTETSLNMCNILAVVVLIALRGRLQQDSVLITVVAVKKPLYRLHKGVD